MRKNVLVKDNRLRTLNKIKCSGTVKPNNIKTKIRNKKKMHKASLANLLH